MFSLLMDAIWGRDFKIGLTWNWIHMHTHTHTEKHRWKTFVCFTKHLSTSPPVRAECGDIMNKYSLGSSPGPQYYCTPGHFSASEIHCQVKGSKGSHPIRGGFSQKKGELRRLKALQPWQLKFLLESVWVTRPQCAECTHFHRTH